MGELDQKRSEWTVQCKKEQENLTKINMAKVAYAEGKTKKSCVDTRIASELNNKKLLISMNHDIKDLQADCKQSLTMNAAARKEFVWNVCRGVHGDVKKSISGVMKDLNHQDEVVGFNTTETVLKKPEQGHQIK